MSIYSEKLAKIKKDIITIRGRLKKKKFKKHQQVMVDFINGVTNSAEFNINGLSIILKKGDSKKGFQHILEQHYGMGSLGELTTMEILNFINIIEKGVELKNEGKSNNHLVVYYRIDTKHKLVLNPIEENKYVVTMYSHNKI